jgi:hypothetical protein
VLDDLDLIVLRHQRELVVGQVLVLVLLRPVLGLARHQHIAVLLEQRVVEPVVQDQEARIPLHQQVVAVVRLLLGLLLVLRAGRVERDNLVARAKHLHQRRLDPLHGVRNVAHDDLRAAFFLVAVGAAEVGGRPLSSPRQTTWTGTAAAFFDASLCGTLALVGDHSHRVFGSLQGRFVGHVINLVLRAPVVREPDLRLDRVCSPARASSPDVPREVAQPPRSSRGLESPSR